MQNDVMTIKNHIGFINFKRTNLTIILQAREHKSKFRREILKDIIT